jgi:hypothetical protein
MPVQGRARGQITAEGNTAIAAADVAIGAGWGNTATKTVTSGSNDVAGQIVVTSGGTGQSQATATVVITFKSAYASTPRCVLVTTTNDNSIDTGHATYSVTTTALTLTFSVLPVDTKIYKLNYLVIA